jgi:hypothetical protein
VAQITQLARDYGQTQPAAIRLNYGMQRVHGGGNATRAVACLPALVGAWRHRAGGLLMSCSGMFPVQSAALQRPDLRRGSSRTINMSTIGRDLLQPASAKWGPRIEALIVYNSNPVAVAPESGQVVRGFMREDLFTVVLEHFLTDTADHADYVLPATTQLEHWDIHSSYGHTDVPGRLDEGQFPMTGLGHDMLVPVSAPDKSGRPLHMLGRGDILPVLGYSEASGLGRIMRSRLRGLFGDTVGAAAVPGMSVVFTAHNAVLLKTMALEGRGITWLPRQLMADELSQGRLLNSGGPEWQIPLEIRLYRQPADMAAVAESVWGLSAGATKRQAS